MDEAAFGIRGFPSWMKTPGGGVPAGRAKPGPGVKWADGGLADWRAGPSFPRNVALIRGSD
jgi:hypothetical protein